MEIILEFLWWLIRDYLWRPILVMLALFLYADIRGLDTTLQPFMYIGLGLYVIIEIILIVRKIRNH